MLENMSKEKLQYIKDSIADVICWHYGFKSANPNYDAPPGLIDLKEFAANLQMHINSMQ